MARGRFRLCIETRVHLDFLFLRLYSLYNSGGVCLLSDNPDLPYLAVERGQPPFRRGLQHAAKPRMPQSKTTFGQPITRFNFRLTPEEQRGLEDYWSVYELHRADIR